MSCAIVILWGSILMCSFDFRIASFRLGENTNVNSLAEIVFAMTGYGTLIIKINKTASPIQKL